MKVCVERVNKNKDSKRDIVVKELEHIMNNPNELLTFAEIANRYNITDTNLGIILIDSHIMYKNTKGNWITRDVNLEIQDYVRTIYKEECDKFVQYFTQKGRLLIHACLLSWQPKMTTKYTSYLADIYNEPITGHSLEEIANDYHISPVEFADVLMYENIVRKTRCGYVPTDKMLKEQYATVVDKRFCVCKDGSYVDWVWYFTQKGRLLVHEIAHKYYIV